MKRNGIMKTYFLTLIASALCIAMISIIAPDGIISKYVRLLSSLLLICVLLSPIKDLTNTLRDITEGNFSLPQFDLPDRDEAQDEFDSQLDNTSKTYFLQSLARLLEREFNIEPGEVRCVATWNDSGEESIPLRVTVVLSGGAIWKNPKEIEAYVAKLVGCECITAIE